MVVDFCLNRQLHCSQRPGKGHIECVKDGLSLVDAIMNAHLFYDVIEEDVCS